MHYQKWVLSYSCTSSIFIDLMIQNHQPKLSFNRYNQGTWYFNCFQFASTRFPENVPVITGGIFAVLPLMAALPQPGLCGPVGHRTPWWFWRWHRMAWHRERLPQRHRKKTAVWTRNRWGFWSGWLYICLHPQKLLFFSSSLKISTCFFTS